MKRGEPDRTHPLWVLLIFGQRLVRLPRRKAENASGVATLRRVARDNLVALLIVFLNMIPRFVPSIQFLMSE